MQNFIAAPHAAILINTNHTIPMKNICLTKSQIRAGAAICGACLIVSIAGIWHTACSAESPTDAGGGFLAPLKQWQEKMSQAFRDGIRSLGASDSAKSTSSVSADLREQNDSYMLRLNLPNRTLEKVEVNLDGSRLRIVAPEEGNARRYEQTITLSDLPADAKARIERKQEDNLIVVTVPKSSSEPGPAAPQRGRNEGLGPVFRRDQDIVDSMDRMRRDMDRIFEDSFKSFRYLPGYSGWFDKYRFSSTYEVAEEGDHYIVRVYLPDRSMEGVSVKVEGQTLHIDAQAEETTSGSKEKNRTGTKVHRAAYAQRVTLPGPVDATKMKVERKDDMLVVTLPKSKTS
jgi:HSP20 family molecular chaperone IbpA